MEEEAGYDDPMVEDESDGEDELADDIEIEARELQKALLDEEKNGTPFNDIKELWASSKPLISNADDGVSLHTTYIYMLRRMGASLDDIKNVFLEGRTLLVDLFGDKWDVHTNYRRNYAYFLYTKAKQPAEALSIWKEILSTEWKSDPYSWIEAIRLERHYGTVDNARSLLYQGIGAQLKEPYDFYQYFLQFEREEGTRDQVDLALQKITMASNRPNNKQQNKKKERRPALAIKKHTNRGQKRAPDTQSKVEESKKTARVSDNSNEMKNGNTTPPKSAHPKKDADGFAIPSLTKKREPTERSANAEVKSSLGSGQPKQTMGFSLKPRVISDK